MRKIADGDEQAFEKLYNETKGGVFSFIYSYLKNREDAEDAMQTVYLKIKRNIDKFEQSGNGLAWILQIAKNTALNELRQRKVRTDVFGSFETEEAVSSFPEVDGEITSIMKKCLTEEEERIILLHVIWGYKHREIAAILEMPTGSVTSKYKRAADKIKRELKKGGVK